MCDGTLTIDDIAYTYTRKELFEIYRTLERMPALSGGIMVFYRDQTHPPRYERVSGNENFLSLIACIGNGLCSGFFYIVYGMTALR